MRGDEDDENLIETDEKFESEIAHSGEESNSDSASETKKKGISAGEYASMLKNLNCSVNGEN